MQFKSILKRSQTALKSNDKKTLLMIYNGLSSTLRGCICSADRGTGRRWDISQNFGAENYVPSFAKDKKTCIGLRYGNIQCLNLLNTDEQEQIYSPFSVADLVLVNANE